MFRRLIFSCASVALFLLAASAPAQAGDFQLTLGKRTKHGGVALHVGSGGLGVSATYGQSPSCRSYSTRRAPRYGTVRVWVPGYQRKVWIDPVYDTWRDECGRVRKGLVRSGYWRVVNEPGRYELRTRRNGSSSSYGYRGSIVAR